MSAKLVRFLDYLRGGAITNLYEGRYTSKAVGELRRKLIGSAVPIVADNVAEFVYGTGADADQFPEGHKTQFDFVRDFPNLAPPYKNFFIEWAETAPSVKWFAPLIGIHFFTWDLVKDDAAYARMFAGARDVIAEFAAKHHFFLWGDLYIYWKDRREALGPLMHYLIGVGPDGTPENMTVLAAMSREDASDAEWNLFRDWQQYVICPLMTLSFVHCKNVRIVKAPEPPPQFEKAWKKRNGRDLIRYHTIEIEPMKKILVAEGRSATVGLRKALHICRGHFKTYGPEHKLFGRVAGTFWFESHVRGRAEEGLVIQDVAVQVPEKGGG